MLTSFLYLSIFSMMPLLIIHIVPVRPFPSSFVIYILHTLKCVKLSVQKTYSRIIHNSQKVETQIFLNGYMDKQIVVHTYNGTLFSYKKNEY